MSRALSSTVIVGRRQELCPEATPHKQKRKSHIRRPSTSSSSGSTSSRSISTIESCSIQSEASATCRTPNHSRELVQSVSMPVHEPGSIRRGFKKRFLRSLPGSEWLAVRHAHPL